MGRACLPWTAGKGKVLAALEDEGAEPGFAEKETAPQGKGDGDGEERVGEKRVADAHVGGDGPAEEYGTEAEVLGMI